MSLSPKDDPRLWLVPGPHAVKRPPLKARLLYYDLTTKERGLLEAMLEHRPEGEAIKASPETLAKMSGVSARHQWNLINGWTRKDGTHVQGLIERRILEITKKGRRFPHPSPAHYVFHEWACLLRPEVIARQEAGIQRPLPGVPIEPKTGAPSATISDDHRQPLPYASAMVADDSKATTSRARERDSTKATPSLSLANQEGEIDVDSFVQSLLARGR